MHKQSQNWSGVQYPLKAFKYHHLRRKIKIIVCPVIKERKKKEKKRKKEKEKQKQKQKQKKPRKQISKEFDTFHTGIVWPICVTNTLLIAYTIVVRQFQI